MAKEQELYHLIAPEYQDIPHKLQLYFGEDIGFGSLEEGLKAGFVQIRSGTFRGTRARRAIFVKEEELPLLDSLIEKVYALRLKQKEKQARDSIEQKQQARFVVWKPLWEALTEIHQLTKDEEELLLSMQLELKPEDYQLETLERALLAHRGNKERLAEGLYVLGEPLCECSWCTEEKKRSRGKYYEKEKTYFAERRLWLWGLYDHHAVMDEVLDIFEGHIKPEECLQQYYQAINEVLFSPEWYESEDEVLLREQIGIRFEKRIETLKEKALQRKIRHADTKSLTRHAKKTFWPAFEKKKKVTKKEFLRALKEEKIDEPSSRSMVEFERIFKSFSFEAHRFIRDYWGEVPFKEAKKFLKDLLARCQAEVESRILPKKQKARFQALYQQQSDFAYYFPMARSIRRKITFFCGPTNSGKTYAAFEELAKAKSGRYLAPLRLLALEGQEQLQKRGVKASYLTGEERDMVPGAKFIASTIEMCPFEQIVGTAIIDEIQMIADPSRGWAWTNALVGVPAHHVILTGSEDAIPIVKKIAEYLQEPLQIKKFKRFNKLEVMAELATFSSLQPGTALICFSRRDVLGLKKEIQENSDFEVAVIYGALSPDVRREEARRFREGEADILVATDAIGMGLNLPIDTVLFWTTEKVIAGVPRFLQAQEILQIAGRAGRYGLKKKGRVGAFREEDLQRIREGLLVTLEEIQGPCRVMPLAMHLKMIAEVLQAEDIAKILRYFQREIWFSESLFTPLVTDAMLEIADALEDSLKGMTFEEKLTFVRAPISIRSHLMRNSLASFADHFARGEPVPLSADVITPFLKGSTENEATLREAEEQVRVMTLYSWFAYRYSRQFPHGEKANNYRHIINGFIRRSLNSGKLQKCCQRCGVEMPFDSPYRICYKCHQIRQKETKR